ncbi:DUF1684 domain-containing protein [Liquorilactobacillus sicerae]|uniref:DUF1684 domain-containing protein n=1 Tax=Liquorilactobacillus sicerae TaxID=1416943 RepID=UPI002480FEEA|nr:DUF1684 domain-containing protein [Liquorilactobacillus sicerae]
MSNYSLKPDKIDHEFGGVPFPPNFSYEDIQNLSDKEYEKRWQAWHNKRKEKLNSDYGWLSLRSIDWLVDGETVKIKNFPGQWRQSDNVVTYIPEKGKEVTNRNKVIRSPKDIIVDTVADVNVEDFYYEEVRAQLIKRIGSSDRKFAVRQRDPNSDNLKNFKGIKYFKPNKNWVLPANYVPLKEWKNVKTGAVLSDLIHNETAIGNLFFTYKSKKYKFIVFQGHNDDSGWAKKDPKTGRLNYLDNRQGSDGLGFISFRDATTGKETYGGGRGINIDVSKPESVDHIDFNFSTNPPCFFSEYCTCPFAPTENDLPFAISAGEKNY